MDLELTAEQEQIRQMARDFAARELAPHAQEWDEHQHFDRPTFTQMGALGFAGMLIPEEYGGVGADTPQLYPHAGRDEQGAARAGHGRLGA